jgi:hypothetical protein
MGKPSAIFVIVDIALLMIQGNNHIGSDLIMWADIETPPTGLSNACPIQKT